MAIEERHALVKVHCEPCFHHVIFLGHKRKRVAPVCGTKARLKKERSPTRDQSPVMEMADGGTAT